MLDHDWTIDQVRLWTRSTVESYAAAVRKAVLEEAAKVCDEKAVFMDSLSTKLDYEQEYAEADASRVARDRIDECAAAIRALKEKL